MTQQTNEERLRLGARRSWSTMLAFILGIPAGLGVLALFHFGPLHDTEAFRYVQHDVEGIEVVMFFIALAALVCKALGHSIERAACRSEILPAWDGTPVPVAGAGSLAAGLGQLGRTLQQTLLVRRVAAILDFVIGRGSAQQLDDHMRTLSDNDALAVENGYALTRFITWAIPILGFLGTVLGITASIANVTPDILEKNMGHVTDGLALAFDATALALGLTMILMFVNFLVERIEQGTLEAVDRYVDAQIAHRFQRDQSEGNEFLTALRHNSDIVLQATEKLVERQAALWSRTLVKAEQFWAEGARQQQEHLSQALDTALERSLAQHTQRLAELERQAQERSQRWLESLSALAGSLREAGTEQQKLLANVTARLTAQAETLARLQEGETQLVRLQETLQQNLAALAGAGAFEQAVDSMTAAIHLLSARLGAVPVPRGRTAA